MRAKVKLRVKAPLDRATLVERVRRLDIDRGYPRLIMLLVLGVSGAVAFLSSVGLLRSGVDHMAVRYPIAVLAGYLAFLACIRLWVAYRRYVRRLDVDAPDITNSNSNPTTEAESDLFQGGRSGGGGGGTGWGDTRSNPSDGFLDVDLDELWPVALALVAVLSGVLALGYVVWAAPVLLAEVAVDAAVVGTVYRRLRKQDMGFWLDAAVNRTWLPASVVGVGAALLGWGLQWMAPEAASIGAALRMLP